MLILCPKITTRLDYTFRFIFSEYLGVTYELTDSKQYFLSSKDEQKWIYGDVMEGIPCIQASSLLLESNIQPQQLIPWTDEDIITVIQHNGKPDVIASLFYLISRYEEYLPGVLDHHGRYAAYQSAAVQFDFIETCMVNRYICWLSRWLHRHYPKIKFLRPKYSELYTFDIDHPFYKKDIPLGTWFKRSIKTLDFSQENDLYNTFDYIFKNIEDRESLFFILCPNKPSEHDHIVQRDSESFLNLIRNICSNHRVGIHPSYLSNDQRLILEETRWLSNLAGKEIRSSRMHYLKNNIPNTYYDLVSSGIKYDFSMAYGTHCGWRSSTSIPHRLFDLNKNQAIDIIIYPTCIMDSTFEYNYQENYLEKMRALKEELNKYGGLFIPCFHNDILAKEIWKIQFQKTLNDE